MPEEEISVKAKLIDLISEPSGKIIGKVGELKEVTDRDLNELREHLYEYYEGNEQEAERHYQKIIDLFTRHSLSRKQIQGDTLIGLKEILNEYYFMVEQRQAESDEKAETHYRQEGEGWKEHNERRVKILGEALGELQEVFEEYYGVALERQMEAEDRGIEKVGEVEDAYQDLMRSARRAQRAVDGLAASIAALKSKTITITVIRKTVYKTEGKGGGSTGSNPFEGNGGRATLSTAEGKEFTEQVTLPALKTLAREGKIDKVVH